MYDDAGTRYVLLILSMEGAVLDEISVPVNHRQSRVQLSCFIVTSRNEVARTHRNRFYNSNYIFLLKF